VIAVSHNRSVKPMLYDTLSVLLPSAKQTWLLRACLHKGEAGRRAWQNWQESVGFPSKALSDDRQGFKRLLSLLYWTLQDNDTVINRDLLSHLRTVYVYEELRSRAYRRIVRDVLGTLTAENVPCILLNEAALAGTVYPDWALRHCGRLDLLVEREDLSRATIALVTAGFPPAGTDAKPGSLAIRLEHDSGLPIVVQSVLFRIPYYAAPLADMWARSHFVEIEGIPSRILAPPDMLLHVCGHASCSPSRDTLNWVCDAWYMIQQSANLDWALFVEGALHSNLALPLFVMLDYLANRLEASIPTWVLCHLSEVSTATSVIAREAALMGAQAGAQGTLRNLFQRSDNLRARAAVLRWALLPSPTSLRWTQDHRPEWLLPLYYVYRPLRHVSHHLRFDRGRAKGVATTGKVSSSG
jgi:hypothetical protein